MHYYFTALSLVAGICLGFGLLYLFIGLRRKDHKSLNLTFALFALAYGGTLLNGVRFHSTTSLAEFLFFTRWDAIFVVLAFTSLIWYVAFYTEVRPRIFLWGLTAAFVTVGVANIVRPNQIYEEIFGLVYIPLPWGEQLTDVDATGSIWADIFLLAELVTIGFILFAFFRQYRRGKRWAAISLGIGMLWFIATIAFEILGESGIIAYFPLGEFGFLGLAIAISLQMANSVIRTEEALAEYRQNLEELVATRTAELSQSNEQLMREIERRKQAEVVLRESEEMARALLDAPTDAAALLDPAGIVLDANEAMAQRYKLRLEELVGITIWDLMPSEVANRRQAAMTQVMQTGEPIRFEDTREGIWNDNVIYPVFDVQGQVTKVAVMAHDITERKRAEQSLNRRVEELAILHETAQTAANVTDLTPALQQVSETLNYLYAARYTHLLVPAPNGTGLQVIGFEQEGGPIEPAPLTIPLAELPLIGQVLSQGQSLVVPDIQGRPLQPAIQEFITSQNLQNILLVPLMTRSKAIGVMVIATDQVDREFTPQEINLAETIAVDIAAAVENSMLLEQAKEAAAVKERNRIARELHDSVTQSMYSVSIVAEALPRVLERNLDEAKRNAGYLRQTTLGALAEMRTMLFELRPDSLAKVRLDVLLQQLADFLTGRTRVPVEVTVHGQATLPAEVKIALYRIAQEAFNNINKHANATQVWATLHREPDRVILVIRDNGQGFDPAAVPAERLGLRIMQERATAIGANLTLESAPGQGVQLTVRWTDPASQFLNERENST